MDGEACIARPAFVQGRLPGGTQSSSRRALCDTNSIPRMHTLAASLGATHLAPPRLAEPQSHLCPNTAQLSAAALVVVTTEQRWMLCSLASSGTIESQRRLACEENYLCFC